jgi:hypothetical protein
MKMMTKETRLPFVYTSARVKFFLPRKGSSRPTVSRSRGVFFVDRHLFFLKHSESESVLTYSRESTPFIFSLI